MEQRRSGSSEARKVIAVLVALMAVLSLLVAAIRSPDATLGASFTGHTPRHSHNEQLRIEPKSPHVEQALAASLDMTKAPTSQLTRDNSRGDPSSLFGAAAGDAQSMSAIAAARHPTAMLEEAAQRPAAFWLEAVERPTRARARLMVFLN